MFGFDKISPLSNAEVSCSSCKLSSWVRRIGIPKHCRTKESVPRFGNSISVRAILAVLQHSIHRRVHHRTDDCGPKATRTPVCTCVRRVLFSCVCVLVQEMSRELMHKPFSSLLFTKSSDVTFPTYFNVFKVLASASFKRVDRVHILLLRCFLQHNA